MRFLLDLVYLVAAPFVLLYLLVPSRFFTRARYRAGIAEKLGSVSPLPADRPRLLVHAVSVGEVRAALPLVHAFAERFPSWDLVLTTSTDTGFETARRGLEGGPPVPLRYFPFDLSWAVGRALRGLAPRAVLLVELELWPNFLLACRRARIPVLIANGRITERSCVRYRVAGPLGRLLFSMPTAYAVQNETFAARFESLGVPRERIAVLGNLKFDAPAEDGPPPAETLRMIGWGEGAGEGTASPILVGGCTHPGEETAVLGAARRLLERHRGLRVVLAPRHVERATEVHAEAVAAEIGPVERWSALRGRDDDPSPHGPRVVVVDRIGELDRFYRIADVVFVGGSLIPRGGHNMLEPARHGKPVVHGPSVHNFEDIAAHFRQRGAAVEVADRSGLESELDAVLGDAERRADLGRRALEAARELEGALGRHLEWLAARLGCGGGDGR